MPKHNTGLWLFLYGLIGLLFVSSTHRGIRWLLRIRTWYLMGNKYPRHYKAVSLRIGRLTSQRDEQPGREGTFMMIDNITITIKEQHMSVELTGAMVVRGLIFPVDADKKVIDVTKYPGVEFIKPESLILTSSDELVATIELDPEAAPMGFIVRSSGSKEGSTNMHFAGRNNDNEFIQGEDTVTVKFPDSDTTTTTTTTQAPDTTVPVAKSIGIQWGVPEVVGSDNNTPENTTTTSTTTESPS